MDKSTIMIAVITSCTTLAGIILTFIYNLLRERFEANRHNRQIELEERKYKLEEKKLVLEQHNKREIKIFEERLKCYPLLYSVLLKCESGILSELTKDDVMEIKKEITDCVYLKVSHCLSTDSLVAVTDFRNALSQYSDGKINSEQLINIRLQLLQALHKDLGRTGQYLGHYEPLIEFERKLHEKVLSSS